MTPKQQKTIEGIAQKILRIPTLETRSMDSMDFHELAVWQVREALEAAFEAGKQYRKNQEAKIRKK